MSLNKSRKRLIRKYRGYYNGRLLGLKIKTADDKEWTILSPKVEEVDPDSMVMEAGVIDASVLSCDGISLANKEITISCNISKKGFQKMKKILLVMVCYDGLTKFYLHTIRTGLALWFDLGQCDIF